MKMNKETLYVAPEVEVLLTMVEAGFAASGPTAEQGGQDGGGWSGEEEDL